jgi:hypothetical protein
MTSGNPKRGEFFMNDNRKRNVRVVMRLTEEEQDILLQRMDDAGTQNREAYLRKMALAGYILRLDMSEVRETLRLLANATSNINQIAHRANETRSIYASDVVQLRAEVEKLRAQVSDVMKVFGKVRKLMDL